MCKFSFNYNYCFSDNAGGLDQLGLNSIQEWCIDENARNEEDEET